MYPVYQQKGVKTTNCENMTTISLCVENLTSHLG